MPKDSDIPVQISQIIDIPENRLAGHGYLGFIITYPDGRIVNKLMKYDQSNHELVRTRVQRSYINALKSHHCKPS